MTRDVVPFLTAVAAGAKSVSLQSTLPRIATLEATSPWSPKPMEPAPAPVAAVPQIDVEAITAAAIEAGREAGLRETEALRATLTQLIGELEKARQGLIAPAAELIADAAAIVVEGFLGGADRVSLFRPLVEAWMASGSTGAQARCHLDDLEAVRTALGDALITVVADPAIPRGGLTIADATHELAHAWEPRLRELRETIAGALAE